MNFSLKTVPYVGLKRAPSGAAPSAVYDLSGSVYNRFYGGGMTATPTEYTLSAWLRPAQTASTTCVFVRSNGGPGGAYSHCIYQRLGYWSSYAYDGAFPTVNSTTAPVTNQWVHVAASAKNAGFMRLYINGISQGTPVAVGTLWNGGNDWWIAADDGTTSANFSGYMCDAAIWNKQLTASEIASLATGTRNVPPSVQPANLLLFCPMTDAPLNGSLVGNWSEQVGGLSQTRTGAPVGRSSLVGT